MSENPLEVIPPLSPEQRQQAHEQARDLVIRRAGNMPDRERFKYRRISPYPGWITATSLTLLVLLFIVTFLPSAFRLFNAGRDYFEKGIPNEPAQAAVVGFAIFMMAEITVILATVVQRVYFHDGDQKILNMAIVIGVLIAMFGNIVVAKPSTDNLSFQTVFEWLETIGPSIIVFVTSFILKQIMFTSMEHRILNEEEYQEALAEWDERVNKPEEDPKFMQVYGASIKDMISRQFVVGSKARERREYLNSLTNKDWLDLFVREITQENWVPSNIVINAEPMVVDAMSRPEVGSGESPLHINPQPSYGFQTRDSNH